MTKAETLKYVVEKMVAQGGGSRGDRLCMFRKVVKGEERRCAVGWLLSEEQLEEIERWDKMSAAVDELPDDMLRELVPEDWSGEEEVDELRWLTELQTCVHDVPSSTERLNPALYRAEGWGELVRKGAREFCGEVGMEVPEWLKQ